MKRRLVKVLQTLPTVTPLHTWPRVTFGEVKVIVTLSEDPPRCYHAFQQAVTPELLVSHNKRKVMKVYFFVYFILFFAIPYNGTA